MLKIIGVILIAVSCSATGFFMNTSLRERHKALKSFLSAFQIIKAELVFRRAPLPDIIGVLKNECPGVAAGFFTLISKEMESGQSFQSAFAKCSAKLHLYSLTRADEQALAPAMQAFGKYDAQGQAEIISGVIRRLEAEVQGAEKLASEKGKLYKAVAVSAGIMLALIII